jgi:diaminopimelate decarboxylase
MSKNNSPKLALFPHTVKTNKKGHLVIGGCDVIDLPEKYDTPLYVFDEMTLRSKCLEFKREFQKLHSNTIVTFASKAFLNRALAQIINEEGLGLDVVSGGELSVALSVNFPPNKIYFHGNNKLISELKLALKANIGRIIVDNFYELEVLNKLAGDTGINQRIILRITPGIDAHTHRHTTTGVLDSKFGFPISGGQADMAVKQAIGCTNLSLIGLHFHLGSPVPDVAPYKLAIEVILNFAKESQKKHNFQLRELAVGGGFAVKYIATASIPSTENYAESIINTLKTVTTELKIPLPALIIEPGRAIVAQSAVALYTIGAIKDIPGIRTYVCVDGGMGDNIRPALYDAKYEAVLANKIQEQESTTVSIAGKYCESGDILARDIELPPVSPGDVLAMPVSGAYAIPMSSNYNLIPRPAIVLVKDGKSRIIRKRETYKDIMRLDVI